MRLYPHRFYQKWKKVVPRNLDLLTFIAVAIDKPKAFVLLGTLEESVFISWRNFLWIHLQVRLLQWGKPLSYILGEHPFGSSTFVVHRSVLIPRVETEFLVESILQSNLVTNKDFILDIGMGSGVISIELVKKLSCRAVGIDICPRAVKVAMLNRANILQDRAHLLHIEKADISSWIFSQKFSVVISNPPYISTDQLQQLEPSVRSWEPKLALDGGSTGLHFFQKIDQKLSQLLQQDGSLIVEFSSEQARILYALYQPYFKQVLIRQDQFFKDRFLFAVGYKHRVN